MPGCPATGPWSVRSPDQAVLRFSSSSLVNLLQDFSINPLSVSASSSPWSPFPPSKPRNFFPRRSWVINYWCSVVDDLPPPIILTSSPVPHECPPVVKISTVIEYVFSHNPPPGLPLFSCGDPCPPSPPRLPSSKYDEEPLCEFHVGNLPPCSTCVPGVFVCPVHLITSWGMFL